MQPTLLLPPPPWRLAPDFVRMHRIRVGGAVLAALAIAWAAWLGGAEARRIVRDRATWEPAPASAPATFRGLSSARRPWFRVEGWVAFESGSRYGETKRLELDTLWPFPVVESLHVRFDSKDPTRWVASWAVEQEWNRWDYVASVGLLGFGGAAFLLVLAVRSARLLRLARAVTDSGIEQVRPVLDERQVERLGGPRHGEVAATRYLISVDGADGRSRAVVATFPARRGRPLWLPGDHVLVLTARDVPGALVLRQDLWPLRLADAEVRMVAEQLQQLDPEAGWRTLARSDGPRLARRGAPGA